MSADVDHHCVCVVILLIMNNCHHSVTMDLLLYQSNSVYTSDLMPRWHLKVSVCIHHTLCRGDIWRYQCVYIRSYAEVTSEGICVYTSDQMLSGDIWRYQCVYITPYAEVTSEGISLYTSDLMPTSEGIYCFGFRL